MIKINLLLNKKFLMISLSLTFYFIIKMLLLELIILVRTIPLASTYLSTILITDLLFVLSLFLSFTSEIDGGLFQTTTILFKNHETLMMSFIPIIVYSNAETDKNQVLNDNKGKTGIYLWTHLETGKQYVGSSINLKDRLRNYYSTSFLKRVQNKNMIITKALLKHGYSAFSLAILEYIDITGLSITESKKLILEREQHYLDLLKSKGYNILKTAGSTLGFKHSKESLTKMIEAKTGSTHTEETKAKMSLTRKGSNNPFYGKTHLKESLVKISMARRGIIHTEEAKFKISLSKIGEKHPMYGKNHTSDTLAKISLAKSKKVYIYSTDSFSNETILFKSFDNYTETAKYFNCSKRTLSDYVDKNKLYKKKWLLLSSALNNK